MRTRAWTRLRTDGAPRHLVARRIRAHLADLSRVRREVGEADASGLHYMLTLVGGSLEYIRQMSPQWRTERVTHHHGEADHRAYLERPLLEAQAALRARLGMP